MHSYFSAGVQKRFHNRRSRSRRFLFVSPLNLLVALLASALQTGAWAAPAGHQIRFESVEGSVLVVNPDGKVLQAARSMSIEPKPFATAVRVVYGHAVLRVDDAVVNIAEGGSLALRLNSQTGAIAIGAAPESAGEIRISVGKTYVLLKPGDAIALVKAPDSKTTLIKVLAGTVTIQNRMTEVSAAEEETVGVQETPPALLVLTPEPGGREKLDPVSPFVPAQ